MSVLDREVSSVRVILSKELHVSTVHRLAVEYSDNDAALPRTLFLKLNRRNYLSGFEPGDIDRPEVDFYSELAPVIGCPPLIKCYDAALDEDTGRSHVLMEDLMDTHSQPDQKTPPSFELSKLAVEAVANVHRVWWNHSIADSSHHPGLAKPRPPLLRQEGSFRNSDLGAAESAVVNNARRFDEEWLANFVADLTTNVAEFRKAANLTSDQDRLYAQMLDRAPTIWGRLLEPKGLTVTHGDLHWWNFLYPNDTSRDSVRLFDWQLWHVDVGARDLAFLLALGGFAEPRPEIEEDLLRAYHTALDVEDYSFESLMHDYRSSAIRNLNIPIIFWKQKKHYSTWQDALRRACDAYVRLGCDELF
jgi:hypothetical protein